MKVTYFEVQESIGGGKYELRGRHTKLDAAITQYEAIAGNVRVMEISKELLIEKGSYEERT